MDNAKTGRGLTEMEVNYKVDLNPLFDAIENAEDLEDSNELFTKLAEIVRIKKLVEDSLETVLAVEREVKNKVNDRAKVLMGDDWSAVKGQNYKFTRSKSGSVYEIVPVLDHEGNVLKAPADEFVKIEVKPDTKAIDRYREANELLPDCIGLNQQRNDVIRMTVQL